ncbi:MAG: phosphodiester glycosidase family protein [Pseudomonadota bacterium]
MNKLILIFAMFIFLNIFAQDKFKIFSPPNNIGFGKSSDCTELMPFVVNGPLVEEDGFPVGGYIDNFNIKKDWADPALKSGNFSMQNGIFGMKGNGTMFMVSYENRNSVENIRWAFQNGMMLIINGNNICNPNSTNNHFTRSGIGFRADGSFVVVISLVPCTFWELAQTLLENACTNAIYLDGGPPVGYSSFNPDEKLGLQAELIKLQFF